MLRDDMHALDEADRIGYPVLVKPSAGGGGKGMRMVRTPRELESVLRVCRSEAKAAFGDDSLYLEKWLDENRHVEVQVAVDRFGHGIHLGERDCSVQRRHQKILEEAPTPALPTPARADLAERALKAVVAAGYENVGTLEFLVDRDGNFYFIEINCRIQVEHPVTEMLTGVDLVATQMRDRGRRAARLDARPTSRSAATRSSSASTPRIPSTSSGRAPGSSSAITPRAARASGWTRTSSPATRCRPTTTRCSASSSSGVPTGPRPSPAAGSPSRSSSSTAS